MQSKTASLNRFSVVLLFAAAMAWVEAAVVFYLRTLVDRIQPYQEMPLPIFGGLGEAELFREAATMVMLATTGFLAGSSLRSRVAYALLTFGVWDILYYVFLRIMTGWPISLLDWDILFLLPLPWWGPVIAPVSIAFLMIVWATLVLFHPDENVCRAHWSIWLGCAAGAVLALYVFMQDAIGVVGQGPDAVRAVLPQRFNWSLFIPAWFMMALPVLSVGLAYRKTFARRAD